MADIIEVRLPINSDYLPLLRANVGVIAGIMLFNYDEILQLRVAVSEAFNLAIRWANKEGDDEVLMRFVVKTNEIEILITGRRGFIGKIDAEQEVESFATLKALMDQVRFGDGAQNEPMIRMTKTNTTGRN